MPAKLTENVPTTGIPFEGHNCHISKIHGASQTGVPQLLQRHRFSYASSLFAIARTPQQRAQLAKKLNVNPADLEFTVCGADLLRINGIGGQFMNALILTDVRTVAELRTANALDLHARLQKARLELELRRGPTLKEINDWIAQADQLPDYVELERSL